MDGFNGSRPASVESIPVERAALAGLQQVRLPDAGAGGEIGAGVGMGKKGRGQMSEVRCQTPDAGSRKSEVRGQKSEVRRQREEIRKVERVGRSSF